MRSLIGYRSRPHTEALGRPFAGRLYVAAILNGWSRRVVGWSCSATLHTTLVLAALESAIARRQPGSKIIHHSDRGSQYVDTTYRAMLQDHGFVQSMSGAGNC